MNTVLPLEKMTTTEKLRAIEEIWADLTRRPESIPSPSWHEDVLSARARRIREGEAHFTDWAEAKRRILDQTK